MEQPLNLSFPELLEGQEFLTETDTKQLKKLLDDDGSSDLEKEIQRFTQIVFDLNRCPQSFSEWEANLKVLHAKYSGLSNSLRDYSTSSVKSSKEFDELMQALTLEMSFAFKSFLTQLDRNEKWTFRLPKKAAFAANLAIHYLSLLKAEHYALGKALPSYVWRELNQLYYYAESKKLLKVKVKDVSENRMAFGQTITASYASSCLLSAITPYDLARQEIWNLFNYLSQIADVISISDDSTVVSHAHCFLIDLEQSQRPMIVRDVIEHESSFRYINIDEFTQLIKKEISAFASGMDLQLQFLSHDNIELKEKLLQKMYRYSVQYIARESDRYPIEVEAKTVWGLSEIINLLESEVDISGYQATPAFMENLGKQDFKLPLVWQTVNESKGGACIQEQQHRNLNIADATPLLVSKHLPKQQGKWQLAISRWHKDEGNANLVGIQYIKGAMQLAKIANNENQKMVSIGPDEQGRYFLLTPPNHLRGLKNFALALSKEKLLVNCKSFYECVGADLVQIQIGKKSL